MRHVVPRPNTVSRVLVALACLLALATRAGEPSRHEPVPPIPLQHGQEPRRMELGMTLLYDPRLSADNGVNCTDCHHLAAAVAQLRENSAPVDLQVASLYNILLHFHLFPGAAGTTGEIPGVIEELQAFSRLTEAERPLFDNILSRPPADMRLPEGPAEPRDRYTVVPSDEHSDAPHRDYIAAYAGQSGRTEVFSLVLPLVAAALFIGLGVTSRALYLSRERVKQAHDQLRSAVECLSDAFALFAPDGRPMLYNRCTTGNTRRTSPRKTGRRIGCA